MTATTLALSRQEIARSVARQVAAGKQVIAGRLRALREQHDPPLTQEAAAQLIGVAGRTYNRWEAEEDPTIPYFSSVEKIANAYGIDAHEIIGGGDSPFDQRLARIEAIVLAIATQVGVDVEPLLVELEIRSAAASGSEGPAPGRT